MLTNTSNQRNLVTTTEAASYLGVPVGIIRYWIHLKRLPSFKVGRRRLLAQSDLDAFLETCREEAV